MAPHSRIRLLLVCLLCLFLPLVSVVSIHAAGEALSVTISQLVDDEFPDVTAYFTVLGPNGIPLAGLDSESLSVTEDGNPIDEYDLNLVQHTSAPLTLAIAIDRSNSMWLQDEDGRTALQNTLDAVATLLQKLGVGDTVGIYIFSSEVELLQDFTIDKELAERSLTGFDPEGATVLWDAVHEAAVGLKSAREGRKAILVVTDGKEGEGDTIQSSTSFEDLITEMSEAGLPVFPVGFGDVDVEALGRLAEETGGELYISEGVGTLSDEFDEVLQRLQLQYALHFRSNLPADGGEHSLTVTVSHSGNDAAAESIFTALLSECQITLPELQDGQAVRGVITIEPVVACRSETAEVTFSVDGEVFATLVEPPFNIEWDSTEAALGAHDLMVSAIDTNGNTGQLELAVEVGPDSLSMVLNAYQHGDLMDYEEGKPVAGVIVIEPVFIGPAAITRVDYSTHIGLPHMHHEDQPTPLFSAREPPFQLEWLTPSFEPGFYTLTVLAEDEEGNTAEAALGVEIVPAITLQLLAPTENAQLSGEITLQAEATALYGLQRVEFLVDDTLIVSLNSEPFDYNWDTDSMPPGEYTLFARAIDSRDEMIEVSVPVTVQVGANLGFLVVLVVAGVAVAIVFAVATASRRRNIRRSSSTSTTTLQ